jgi:hypothetical protein
MPNVGSASHISRCPPRRSRIDYDRTPPSSPCPVCRTRYWLLRTEVGESSARAGGRLECGDSCRGTRAGVEPGDGPHASRKHGARPGFPRMRCVRPQASLAENGEVVPAGQPRAARREGPHAWRRSGRGTTARQAHGFACAFPRASRAALRAFNRDLCRKRRGFRAKTQCWRPKARLKGPCQRRRELARLPARGVPGAASPPPTVSGHLGICDGGHLRHKIRPFA